jgi:hypothetical protein
MPRTGETCPASGVYKCDSCNKNTIPLSKGERFPPCSVEGGKAVNWTLKQLA